MNKKVIKVKDIDLGELKRLLNKGDMTKIAKETGYTPNYVRMVLNPNDPRFNQEIVKSAIKLIESEGYIEMKSELANSLTG